MQQINLGNIANEVIKYNKKIEADNIINPDKKEVTTIADMISNMMLKDIKPFKDE